MNAVAGSGISSMSLSLMAAQAADARSVKAETFLERFELQLRDGVGHVVPQTGKVGEAQISLLGVVLFSKF